MQMTKRIAQRGGFYQNLGFGAGGAALGAATTLIALATTQNVPTWSWVMSWVIFGVSLALSVFGFFASYHEGSQDQVSQDAILAELNWIKESADNPQARTAAPIAAQTF